MHSLIPFVQSGVHNQPHGVVNAFGHVEMRWSTFVV